MTNNPVELQERVAPDYIQTRLDAGQQVNAYERNDDRWTVAVGPVTGCQRIAICETEEEARFVANCLRAALSVSGDKP